MKAEVVIYGASGYTGKRLAARLAQRGIPFVAAGRSQQRLREQLERMDELRGTDYDVVAVTHDEEALTSLLRDAKVVFNLVGPFMQLGVPVVQAALNANCHYLDASGEQDWMLYLQQEYAQSFESRNLVISPCCSAMWNAGLVVAEACLAQADIDSLDIVYALIGVPSVASTLSFMRACCQPMFYLENGQLVPWEPATVVEVAVPGIHQKMTGLPWGGGGESIWYQSDHRVRNCTTMVAWSNEDLMSFLSGRMKEFAESYADEPLSKQEEITNQWALEIAPDGEPPEEDPDIHRCMVSCHGRGKLNNYSVTMSHLGGYALTSIIGVVVIETLLAANQESAGFISAPVAVGPERFLSEMQIAGGMGQPNIVIS